MESKHFTPKELACPCCDAHGINPSLVVKLDFLREECGFPFVISSAYRCVSHNRHVKGATQSPHLSGRAVDIAVYGKKALKIVELAPKFGFTGIGINQKGHYKSRFVHLDTVQPNDPTAPRPWIWTY